MADSFLLWYHCKGIIASLRRPLRTLFPPAPHLIGSRTSDAGQALCSPHSFLQGAALGSGARIHPDGAVTDRKTSLQRTISVISKSDLYKVPAGVIATQQPYVISSQVQVSDMSSRLSIITGMQILGSMLVSGEKHNFTSEGHNRLFLLLLDINCSTMCISHTAQHDVSSPLLWQPKPQALLHKFSPTFQNSSLKKNITLSFHSSNSSVTQMSCFKHTAALSDREVRKAKVFKRKTDSSLLLFLNKSQCSKITNHTHTKNTEVQQCPC